MNEIDRSEFDGDAPAVHRIGQGWIVRPQGSHGVEAAGLQKDLQALLRTEGRNFLGISRSGRLQHAKYQRNRRVAGRHLYLWYFFSNGQRFHQRGEVPR